MNLQCFNLAVRDQWALLEIARPAELNVLNETILLELEEVLASLKEQGIKVVVITGQGRAFAAGADVAAMAKQDARGGAQQFSQLGNRVFQKLRIIPQYLSLPLTVMP